MDLAFAPQNYKLREIGLVRKTFDFSLFLTPLVFLPHLLLLARGEVVLDVEGFPDLLRSLAWMRGLYETDKVRLRNRDRNSQTKLTLDHVGDGLAGDVEEPLDVQVVGGQDQLEQGALVHLHIC